METYPLYGIRVEMWHVSPDDYHDMEYCGEFLWGLSFASGATLIFDSPSAALTHCTENKRDAEVCGFEYRYRIQPLDNSDGAFDYA